MEPFRRKSDDIPADRIWSLCVKEATLVGDEDVGGQMTQHYQDRSRLGTVAELLACRRGGGRRRLHRYIQPGADRLLG